MKLKRLRKWAVRALFALFALVAGVLVGVPLLVSGDWGRGRIENALSAEIGRPVRVSEVDFGWLGGFEIRGVSIGAGDPAAFRIAVVRAHPDVLSLTTDRPHVGTVEVEGLEVRLLQLEDGSLILPGFEPRGRPPERSLFDRAAFRATILDSSIRVTDPEGAVLLALSGFEGAASRGSGPAVPWEIASAVEGIRVEGIATVGETLALGGQVELAGFDLARLAPAVPGFGGPDGLAGRIEGRIAFSAGENLATELEATLRARDPRVGPGGLGWDGTVEIGGRLSFSGGTAVLSGWQVYAPGVSLYLASGRVEDGSARAQVRVSADLPALRHGLTGADIPLLDGRLEAQATIVGRAALWTTELEASFESLSGAPLVAPLPCLGARVTLAGTVEGRDGFTHLSLGNGLVAGGGGMRAAVVGSMEFPFRAGRRGSVAVHVKTVCPPVPRSLLAGPTVFSEGAGDLNFGVDGRRIVAEAEFRFAEFSVRRPIGPPVEAPGLTAKLAGGVDLDTGEAFLDALDVAGPGISVSLDGQLSGLPLRPEGTARIRASGEVSGLAPLFPAGDSPPAGTFVAEIDAEPIAGATAFTGSVLLSGYDLGAGLAGDGASVRFAVNVPTGAGPFAVDSLVAELPAGRVELSGSLDPEEGAFLASGTVRGDLAKIPPEWRSGAPDLAGAFAGTVELSEGPEGRSARGSLDLDGLRVGTGFKVGAAKLGFDIHAGDRTEFREVVLASERERIRLEGWLGRPGEPEFVGSMEWKGSPASLAPEAFAGGLRLAGAIEARAELEASGAGTFTLRGEVIGMRGPLGRDLAFHEKELEVRAAFTWPWGTPLPRFTRGDVAVPSGTLSVRGDLNPSGPCRADVDADLDLGGFVRDHPSLFPAGLVAAGRIVGDLVFAGDPGRPEADPLRMLKGSVDVTVSRAEWKSYELSQGRLALAVSGGTIRATQGEAVVNGGQANLTGAWVAAGSGPRLDLGVATKAVALAPPMEPEVRFLIPPFGGATDFSGGLDLDGVWEADLGGEKGEREPPAGTVRVSVGRGTVSGSPLLREILKWLERDESDAPVEFESISGSVTVLEGRALTDGFRFETKGVALTFSGYTARDGSIDYKVGVLLPEDAPERARWEERLDADGAIPIRIVGTLTTPSLRAPDAGDLAGSLLEDLLRRARERREAGGGD